MEPTGCVPRERRWDTTVNREKGGSEGEGESERRTEAYLSMLVMIL